MKYYYLFVLIAWLSTHIHSEKSELSNEQGNQIDCLIITNQNEEKAVINKADGLASIAYYIGEMFNKVTPMAVNDQFSIPVHKYGIPGKEPNYLILQRKPSDILSINGCYS